MNTVNQACILENVNNALENGCGYSQSLSFTPVELKQILSFIEAQWLAQIATVSSEYIDVFRERGIARYHELAHLIDHSAIWRKPVRIFSREVVSKIKEMSMLQQLANIYENIEIVDHENIGYEEIYWRLVRPNAPGDVGSFHADAWFSELGHGKIPSQGRKAVKIWVSICSEPGLNGLQVVPYSHKKKWRYHGEEKHGFIKPQIDEPIETLNPVLLKTPPGNAVAFNELLLHTGAVNRGSLTRVSIEFMLFVNQ